MLNYAAFFLYFPISIYALYKMKVAPAVISLEFAFGFMMYGLGAMLWIYALRKFPLSFAFPFAAGLLIVGTQVSGYYFLNERINLPHLVAMAFLLAGLALLLASREMT